MSAQTFQTCLARLIVEPVYRDGVRARGEAALDADLTPLERTRLCRIASDPGVDVNRTLHKGFRLGKLRAMLPMTCRVLGSRRLSREVSAFWAQLPPSSFYFIPEALEFCDFLAARALRAKYLDEVMAYERATLVLESARLDAPPPQHVRFDHDPTALLPALARGRRLRSIAPRRCTATGERGADGKVHWQLVDEAPPQSIARRPRRASRAALGM